MTEGTRSDPSVGFVVQSDRKNYKPFRNQPLNALHFLTILDDNFQDGYNSLVDLRGIEEENFIYHIPEKDVFLYSITSINYLETTRAVKTIRERYPDAKHVAGGIHVNLFPEESSEVFDAIALGEGEENIVKIIDDVRNSNLKKVYNQTNPIDINSFPHPSREYLPKSAVVEKGLLSGEYLDLLGTAVLFSRDCPYNCSFCANPVQKKARFRSPDRIKDEINYLKDVYGIEALAIKDDQAIPSNPNIAKNNLEAIAETNIKWRGQCRANGISRDTLKLAKYSGCVDLAIGIESVSQDVLDIVNKKIDLGEARKFLNYCEDEGIGRRIHLIMGLPGEKENIVEESIKFIEETRPSSVLLSLLAPTPGSDLYENPSKYGIKLHNVPFDEIFSASGRFDKDEETRMIFEYEKETPFGKSMSNSQIIENHERLLDFLWDKDLNF